MTGDINVNLISLTGIPSPINDMDVTSKLYMKNSISSTINSKLVEMLIWEYYKTNAGCTYKIDAASSEVLLIVPER